MAGDEGKHLMFFQDLMQRHGGSTAGHGFSLPAGFPPQVHLPMPGAYPAPPFPGAYTCAGPGYAYAEANAYAYPPAGSYAYPPQGYPHPGLPAPPHHGHGISCHGGGRRMERKESKPKAAGGATAATASGGRQMERMESKPKAAGGTAAAASATAASGGIGHGSSGGHGGRRQIEVIESAPKPGGGTAAAAASASVYGALDKLTRGQPGNRTGAFGFIGKCCGGNRGTGTASFKHADDDHGHQDKFKDDHHRPAKVKHVHGEFRSKSTTWNY